MRNAEIFVAVTLLLAGSFRVGVCDPPPPPTAPAADIALVEGVRLDPIGKGARSIVHTDAVEARIVGGTWSAPKAGDALALPDGTSKVWAKVHADAQGAFEGDAFGGGAYLSIRVTSVVEEIRLLHAVGNDFVYVNGDLRPGDPYGYGWMTLPVLLRKGDNEFLFRVSRGRLAARLGVLSAPVFFSPDDVTAPDARNADGVDGQRSAAVVLVNASPAAFSGHVDVTDTNAVTSTPVAVAPLSVAKVRVRLPPPPFPDPRLALALFSSSDAKHPVATRVLELRVRSASEVHKRTYVSDVDGSVQYYAVNPPPVLPAEALILSLHGAGVEALGQAEAYGRKPFEVVVCPTNRRPFGFDWEDWGRWDALDVLHETWGTLLRDKSRVYLTGHSMGGHGTWQLGVLQPDRFAAIGPSAGWISFASYGGGAAATPDPIEGLLSRGASSSDTLAYASNLSPMGVYVLHGDADDNVPISEAKAMAERLAKFHRDFRTHWQPGAGHWWDASDEPGADCVDWAPMMDFFARHRLPALHDVREIDFVTPDPAVSRHDFWLEIRSQMRSGHPSRAHVRMDFERRRFVGTTDNVSALAIDVSHLATPGPIEVDLDGTKLLDLRRPPDDDPAVRLEREGDAWREVRAWSPGRKNAARGGAFKAAFDHRFQFVYATKGTQEENAWAFAKARHDAELWWYRANGSVEVIADTAFDAKADADRSVVLYGNSETNGAWSALLGDGPVVVSRSGVKVGSRDVKGANLTCLFVRPRPNSEVASVGVVSGTGIAGMRLATRMPYFSSGVGIPDFVVLSTDMLSKGAEGVRGAGFFGNDWSVEKGEFVWR